MKILKEGAAVLTILSMLFSLFGCSRTTYQEYRIGDCFGTSRDGYFKKLPQNYCMEILLNETTAVFVVPRDMLNMDFFLESVYNETPVIKGHYVLGWFNETHLFLCEEKADDTRVYIALKFGDNSIIYYDTEEEMFNEFNFNSNDWFKLCNTNDERIK